MAVVTAPILSFSASGAIAKTVVFASWKGRGYARQYLVPANPKSTEQMLTRNTFAWLSDVWKISPAEFRAPWAAYAKGLVMTDRNAWIMKNNGNLRDGSDLDGIVLSPGAAGGLSIAPTITGGAGSITATMAVPSPLPPGWTIVSAVLVAIKEQSPQEGTDFQMHVMADSSTPFAPAISGVAAGEYQAGAWFVYQRSPAATDLAYGAANGQLVTVT